MTYIKQKNNNIYTVNDKLVKIIGNKIIYLDNLTTEEKKSFLEHISKTR